MKHSVNPFRLREYEPFPIEAENLSRGEGQQLWEKFGSKIDVSEPSFKNGGKWILKSLGWVGFIPFSDRLSFLLEPKIPLKNLFGMLEYAYKLSNKQIEFLSDLYQSLTLQEFYENLANILAKRILDRGRKGYYRTYLSRTEDLSYLRGRLDLHQMINKPWEPRPRCHYQEHTADIEENQILAWTLNIILRSGFCTERVLPTIRNSYRNLSHISSLYPFAPDDCLGRLYNRLNDDYQPLHSLCRFFLENSGPSYEIGDHFMIPFLVNMADLFELFVTEWLRKWIKENFQQQYAIADQEPLIFGEVNQFKYLIDIVIYDVESKKPICILDTKYKKAEHNPSPDDISQVIFYAHTMKCNYAILVYPDDLYNPMDEIVNGIRIRTATFSLAGDLEQAGKEFFRKILQVQKS